MTRRQSTLRRSSEVTPRRDGWRSAWAKANDGATGTIAEAPAEEADDDFALSLRESLDSGVGAGTELFSEQAHTPAFEQAPPLPQHGQVVDAFAAQQLP